MFIDFMINDLKKANEQKTVFIMSKRRVDKIFIYYCLRAYYLLFIK